MWAILYGLAAGWLLSALVLLWELRNERDDMTTMVRINVDGGLFSSLCKTINWMHSRDERGYLPNAEVTRKHLPRTREWMRREAFGQGDHDALLAFSYLEHGRFYQFPTDAVVALECVASRIRGDENSGYYWDVEV